jgi:hypothetical protein
VYYQSQQLTFGTAFLNTLIAALKTTASGPLIDTGKLRLITQAAWVPTPGATIAALEAAEATFTGYTAGGIAVVLSTAVNLSPTCQGCLCSGMFTASAVVVAPAGSITGYWIDDGTNVIVMEAFAGGQVLTFANPGDFLDLNVAIPAQARQAAA